MDLDTYLTTNVLDTFGETLGMGNHHMDVAVVVIGVFGVDVLIPATDMGLCIPVFKVLPSFKPIESLCWISAPS